jgi:hypothetical protein
MRLAWVRAGRDPQCLIGLVRANVSSDFPAPSNSTSDGVIAGFRRLSWGKTGNMGTEEFYYSFSFAL